MPNRDYHDERRQYTYGALNETDLEANPFRQFSLWMDEAHKSTNSDPTAVSIATAGADGQPHNRIVLLKAFDENGMVFYTHYDSDKGQEITENSKGAMLFFWPEQDRQIRLEGTFEKVSHEQSEAYFQSRPRESQLAALISEQSHIVTNRDVLETNMQTARENEGDVIACPENWGGYRLVPRRFEFWQGRPNRLHDRLRYEKDPKNDQAWYISRLAP